MPLVLVLGMAAAACSSAGGPEPTAPLAMPGSPMTEAEIPHMLTASRPLQCVP